MFTGVAGVPIGEENGATGQMTCVGLRTDQGEVYNLAINPREIGLQWGGLATVEGETGQNIEDADTGEVVVRAGQRVAVTTSRPPSEGGHCDLPVLQVESIEVMAEDS